MTFFLLYTREVEIIMNELNKKCPYMEDNCNASNCDCAKYKAYEKVNIPGEIEKKLLEMGLDKNADPWVLLMTMQKSLAGKFHNVENLTKTETDYWSDKYMICIDDEIREVREHLHVYPDDTSEPKNNVIELKKEIIDILHFVMDLFIVGNATGDTIKKHYMNKFCINGCSPDHIDNFLQYSWDNQYFTLTDCYKILDHTDINLLTNKLQDAHSKVRQLISWKHWKKPSETINYNDLYNTYADVFKALIDLFVIMDMEWDEIKDIYVKKNIENIFRQDFGY
jgi:dimeric dUTPase (all-alpha-NTP-PPase superfamily)